MGAADERGDTLNRLELISKETAEEAGKFKESARLIAKKYKPTLEKSDEMDKEILELTGKLLEDKDNITDKEVEKYIKDVLQVLQKNKKIDANYTIDKITEDHSYEEYKARIMRDIKKPSNGILTIMANLCKSCGLESAGDFLENLAKESKAKKITELTIANLMRSTTPTIGSSKTFTPSATPTLPKHDNSIPGNMSH